jgi:AraC-like DNA-binding protein
MLQSPRRSRFSTDQLPAKERFELYREALFHRHMHVEFIDRSSDGFRFDLDFQDFGSVTAGLVHGTPSSFIRKRQHFSDGRDVLSVIINRAGRFRAESTGAAADASSNGAIIMASRHEVALHAGGGSTWSLCLEREPLVPLLAGIEEPLLHQVSAEAPALRLLTGYLETLFALDQDCDPVLASTHLGDLVVSALGVRGDVQALVRERGVTAARQHAVLDSIARNAGDSGIDPARVAQRLGVSVRYLHRLLEPTGRSFAEHLLAQRLERAADMLRDPGFSHLRIAEIAAAAGFADISHFNRSFRRAFGDVPLGMRVRAARRAGH